MLWQRNNVKSNIKSNLQSGIKLDRWGAGVVFATIKDQIGLAKMSRCRSGMVKKCFELICRGYI